MRAVVMHEFGGEDVLRLEEVETPAPGPGEALVRVAAVEVSRTRDIGTRTGRHPFSQFVELPRILGGDCAGVVEAVGAGVDEALVGRRVAVSATQTCGECAECRAGHQERCPDLSLLGVHRDGSYAEYAVAQAQVLHPIPDDLSLSEAAAMAADGTIALTQLEVAGVDAASRLLVTGASGALGTTLAALGAHFGATVIGLSRRPEAIPAALDVARADAADPNLADTLDELTGGAGLSAVAENVSAAEGFAAYFPALAIGARIVVSGAIVTPEGLPVLPVPAVPLYVKSISLLGVRTAAHAARARFWKLVAEGFRLPPGLIHELPLERAAEAQAQITAGTHLGHTLLTTGA
jgi:L-gulonate 5-dehydrogenase